MKKGMGANIAVNNNKKDAILTEFLIPISLGRVG